MHTILIPVLDQIILQVGVSIWRGSWIANTWGVKIECEHFRPGKVKQGTEVKKYLICWRDIFISFSYISAFSQLLFKPSLGRIFFKLFTHLSLLIYIILPIFLCSYLDIRTSWNIFILMFFFQHLTKLK